MGTGRRGLEPVPTCCVLGLGPSARWRFRDWKVRIDAIQHRSSWPEVPGEVPEASRDGALARARFLVPTTEVKPFLSVNDVRPTSFPNLLPDQLVSTDR